MNEKLKAFWKKTKSFFQTNGIAIAIIAGLILFSGGLNSCANKKIATKDAKIAQLNKDNKALQTEIDENKEAYILLDVQVKELLKEIGELKDKNKEIEKDKIDIAKKYADFKAKFGNLSQAEQDQLLITLLKKYDITAEVRDNSLVITMTDRGKLYTFIISIDEVKEQLIKSDEGWANCKITVQLQGAAIVNREEKIKLKDIDITKLNKIITNKDEIIKNYKSKLFWTKVGMIGKTTIPALIIGLVIGFVVAK